METRKLTSVLAAQIVCGASLLSIVAFAGIAIGLSLTGLLSEGGFVGLEGDTARMIGILLIAVSISVAGLSFPLRKLLTARIPSGAETVPARTRVALISMTLAEFPGVAGLMHILLTGEFSPAYVMWGMALAAGIFHFPTRPWLEGAV